MTSDLERQAFQQEQALDFLRKLRRQSERDEPEFPLQVGVQVYGMVTGMPYPAVWELVNRNET